MHLHTGAWIMKKSLYLLLLFSDITEQAAMQQVTDLKTSGRYLQDIWT